jgi:O-antigen/teichoic acid export membrane protein
MRGTTEVANLRAVLPLAGLNLLVIFTFTLLFMPMAARLFAQGDAAAMSRAYWQSAIWLAVLSFPMFALTGPLARPVTVFLFGHQYRGSANVLSVLAIGMYFNAALGFNALTLQTYGRLKFVACVNLTCVALNIGLMLVLIPHFGALGVAIAACATLVLQNTADQIGMRREIGIPIIARSSGLAYVTIVAVSLGLWALEIVLHPGILVAGLLAAFATVVVLRANRKGLNVSDAFPELARIPLIGTILK